MAQYYFFTDPEKLKTQEPDQAFGAVEDTDPARQFDQYRITDLHSSSSAAPAPAIAICDGLICVQPDDQGTFSIVLKPNYQPPFDFPYIKYFIYKGVSKGSLVTLNAIVEDSSIPFTERIHKAWVDDPNSPNPISESDSVLGLAYEASFEHSDTNTKIFTNADPIDNFFYYSNKDFQLPLVRAGEKIGDFDTAEFGFEIVLERLGYEPIIELARTKVNFIKVASFTRANPAPDDADYFIHWHEKEQCLNYIDPCAFYGSFSNSKVYYKSRSDLGAKTKLNTPQKIYDDLLVSFENKNKIYLDIRNSQNYSIQHTLLKNADIIFQDRSNPSGVTVFKSLTESGWPIMILSQTDFVSATRKTNFSLRFPCPTNEFAIAYVQNGSRRNPEFNRRATKILEVNNGYSDHLKLNLQIVNQIVISRIVKIQIFLENTNVGHQNLTQRNNYKGDNLAQIAKINVNKLLSYKLPSVTFPKNHLMLNLLDRDNFSLDIPAICLNKLNVILFTMPRVGRRKGKEFVSRDYTSNVKTEDTSTEEVFNFGNKNLKNIINEKVLLQGKTKYLPVLDETLYIQYYNSLLIPNSHWVLSLTKGELMQLLNDDSIGSIFSFNTTSEIIESNYRIYKIAAHSFIKSNSKVRFGSHINTVEMASGNMS